MPIVIVEPDSARADEEQTLYEQYLVWLAAHPDSTTSFESWIGLIE